MQENYNKHSCFYCNHKLRNDIEVDHFIPWTFVRDEKFWNFVLSCRTCDNSKRDKLTEKSFIKKLLEQNNYIINHANSSYLVRKEYKFYKSSKIIEMYNCAEFNGFKGGWMPKCTDL